VSGKTHYKLLIASSSSFPALRHGCRWFHTEAMFRLMQKRLKNSTFLCALSGFIFMTAIAGGSDAFAI